MNRLFVVLLVYMTVCCARGTPLPPDTAGNIQTHTAPHDYTRYQRDVPDTSYARPEEDQIGFKLNVPESEDVSPHFNKTEQSSFDGNFAYSFDTNNGISVETKGSQKQIGQGQGQVMEGRYSYTAPDGTHVSVQWYADETGYHATLDIQPKKAGT